MNWAFAPTESGPVINCIFALLLCSEQLPNSMRNLKRKSATRPSAGSDIWHIFAGNWFRLKYGFDPLVNIVSTL